MAIWASFWIISLDMWAIKKMVRDLRSPDASQGTHDQGLMIPPYVVVIIEIYRTYTVF